MQAKEERTNFVTSTDIVRGWYEYWTEFDSREKAGRFVAEDVKNHGILIKENGLDAFVGGCAKVLANNYSSKSIIDELIEKDDIVVARVHSNMKMKGSFMGMNVDGKSVVVDEISIFRVAGNMIVEWWTQIDSLSMLHQLGFFLSAK